MAAKRKRFGAAGRLALFALLVLILVIGIAAILALRHGRSPARNLMERYMPAVFNKMHHRLLPAAAALAGLAGPAAADAGPVPPTRIGINVSLERVFANLAFGGRWVVRQDGEKRQFLDAPFIDANGELKSMPPGGMILRPLAWSKFDGRGVTVNCSWQGKGMLGLQGKVSGMTAQAGKLSFTAAASPDDPPTLALKLLQLDAADPIRAIDCREAAMPLGARFDPAFVASLKGFQVLRFMDLQNTNANEPVTWATRHTPVSADIRSRDGMAVEDIVALAKAVDADPWVNMPWNADAEYITGFARYMHDNLPANRRVYVELGNEIWNYSFKAAHQALDESDAQQLAQDRNVGRADRYAARMIEVMDLWSKVFADQPRRLVRVAAGQNNSPGRSRLTLDYRDAWKHVDALATAPYFGRELNKQPGQTADTIFAALPALITAQIDKAAENKAIAASHGLRYISYEGGQTLIMPKDMDLLRKVQRDPRMYDMYKLYIDQWRSRVGDLLMLYSSASPIAKFGAWGLAEYPGQPPGAAPKLRAVMEEIGR